MDHFREIKNNLVWHNEGNFEVELVNGRIARLNFSELGKGPHDMNKSLTSTNYKYLQAVYNCLGDLFSFIEEENKKMGYRYAFEDSFKTHKHQEIEGTEFPIIATETRLRPIRNYEQENLVDYDDEDQNHLVREIG